MVAMGKRMSERETLAMRYNKIMGYANANSLWSSSHGSSVCVRCSKVHPIDSPNSSRGVPVSFVFQDESLCPEHTLEAIHEAGLTLDEAICGNGCWEFDVMGA